ncbi:uncharacterized protein SCHCODRAFT_02525046 [Schizophyllum commune H4-8]|nr:uncharacterized protein SCHCODRAFT_02525046 [Schizophyllum commune H4-8]KAI5899874.1 hypothetical protein SCHCODRAFT_02525046 [Schizophyllum commune H4-8]
MTYDSSSRVNVGNTLAPTYEDARLLLDFAAQHGVSVQYGSIPAPEVAQTMQRVQTSLESMEIDENPAARLVPVFQSMDITSNFSAGSSPSSSVYTRTPSPAVSALPVQLHPHLLTSPSKTRPDLTSARRG